jgi:hypothetical protein
MTMYGSDTWRKQVWVGQMQILMDWFSFTGSFEVMDGEEQIQMCIIDADMLDK